MRWRTGFSVDDSAQDAIYRKVIKEEIRNETHIARIEK